MKKIIFFSLLCFEAKLCAPLTVKQQQMVDDLIIETQDAEFDVGRYIFASVLYDPKRYVSEIDPVSRFGVRSFKRNFQPQILKDLDRQIFKNHPDQDLNKLILFFLEQHLEEAQGLYFHEICLTPEIYGLPRLMCPQNIKNRAKYLDSIPALLSLLRAARAYLNFFRQICRGVSNEHSTEEIMYEKKRRYLFCMQDTSVVMSYFVEDAKRICPVEIIEETESLFGLGRVACAHSSCSMM